jgi:hypothetical protein
MSAFDAAAFKAELRRELAPPAAVPGVVAAKSNDATTAQQRAVSVEVISMPSPRRWRMTPIRDEENGLILWVDLEARE